MKSILGALLTSLLATSAMAAELNCLIREGGALKKETHMTHAIDGNSHSITHFETAYTKAYMAAMRGYGVLNFVSKEDNRVFSFYGDIQNGRYFGGNFYMADGTSWVNVECK